MNIVKSVIARIEDSRRTNKNPCKNYATEEAAEKAAQKYAALITRAYTQEEYDLQYMVVYNEAWGRWVVAFHVLPLIQRYGGYVGVAASYNFYCY